ncbi:DUF2784 domain-containing protein [Limnoglobus roseus]|uniref:DUF2784 domain-containing protein n=1 Tax=Limnoglobus roseus TaxID=2598579 RepID=A0A5C1ABQ7_9BACT|nr:DUF2784 domain-containing protein [Limnoglobus roseus]QEL15232.1 hypothetical protein PX52LOC_02147 [Limnoglobus roseus]
MYGILADAMVAAHVGYVAFVLFGQLAIILGAGMKWQWVRNPWFRGLHLLAIGIVVLEEFMGWRCPLTTWEEQLRLLAGQTIDGGTFMGRLLHDVLFIDDVWPVKAIQVLHVAFGVLVVQALIMCPPRLKRADLPR